MARVTLERLDQKLDDVACSLVELKQVFADHVKEARSVHVTVDRLDQSEMRRQWHIKTLWTALVGTAAAVGLTFFK